MKGIFKGGFEEKMYISLFASIWRNVELPSRLPFLLTKHCEQFRQLQTHTSELS